MEYIKILLAGAGLSTAVVSAADAGGFALRERSAAAQGASFAGSTAAASDVTFSLFNPAALSRVETFETGFNASVILPDIKGVAVNGETQKPGVIGVVPSTALGYRVNENVVLGLGVYSPFGLTTDYDTDFIGAFDGVRSELISIAVQPAVSVDLSSAFSIGAGVAVIYNDPQLTSISGVDPATGARQETKLNATEFEFSGSLGALWQATPDTRIGAAFQTGYDITTGGVLSTFSGSTPIELDGDASISLPMSASLGVFHQLNDRLAVMGEFEWSNWSEFDEIRVDVPALTPNNDIGERTNYKDSIFVAIGAEYQYSDTLTLRTGFAFDQTPTQLDGRSIRIPDGDRIWASVGLSYQMTESLKIDAGYSAIFFMDTEAQLLNGPAAGSLVTYSGQTHILSIGGTYTF
ncbi:MAG: outer membrane protein transport protein [Pseudomonadota bacterium]